MRTLIIKIDRWLLRNGLYDLVHGVVFGVMLYAAILMIVFCIE